MNIPHHWWTGKSDFWFKMYKNISLSYINFSHCCNVFIAFMFKWLTIYYLIVPYEVLSNTSLKSSLTLKPDDLIFKIKSLQGPINISWVSVSHMPSHLYSFYLGPYDFYLGPLAIILSFQIFFPRCEMWRHSWPSPSITVLLWGNNSKVQLELPMFNV